MTTALFVRVEYVFVECRCLFKWRYPEGVMWSKWCLASSVDAGRRHPPLMTPLIQRPPFPLATTSSLTLNLRLDSSLDAGVLS